MEVLKVQKLSKKFKNVSAVRDVSFSLREGEILGFLGPNGAGKTTTIQMLLGVLLPTQGEIFYFGKSFARHREEILEYINFSSTYTNLPWDLTVRENFTFISYLYDIDDRRKRLADVVRIFRLQKLWNEKIHSLSAGQLTRVNLAKAFINFPKVLLLDEPTASLDPDIAQYIREFLLEERKKFQVSVVLTSHNMSEVEAVCDRVIFINKGRIIADDTPRNLTRSIQVCHVELLFAPKFVDRIEVFARTKKIRMRREGRYFIFDVPEKTLPSFLKSLNDAGLTYDEISIDKPNLEDYFLRTISSSKKI